MGKGVFLAFLLMFSLLVSNSFTKSAMGASSAVFCARKCKGRCCKAAEGERCLMYCKICCGKCKCVPPGTYGHKVQCPCYNDMKNSKGKSKCP